MWIIVLFIVAALGPDGSWGCQLPRDWRPQTEACRAELPVLETDNELLFSAEIELLCDQAWGSMLEVPAGSRFNVTGLGYFTCFSYSVTKNNNYYFFLRMDEDYNIIPHGVNFQDPIFPDTPENHRAFASLFQFSNCTSGTQVHNYAPEWEAQEDSRLLCSAVQKALFEEEERVLTLSQKVRSLEKANDHPDQDTTQDQRNQPLKKVLSRTLKN